MVVRRSCAGISRKSTAKKRLRLSLSACIVTRHRYLLIFWLASAGQLQVPSEQIYADHIQTSQCNNHAHKMPVAHISVLSSLENTEYFTRNTYNSCRVSGLPFHCCDLASYYTYDIHISHSLIAHNRTHVLQYPDPEAQWSPILRHLMPV